MGSPDEDQPIDMRIMMALTKYSERFELAVRNGHEIVAAAVAQGIVQGFRRFFPGPFSNVCAEELGIARGPSFLRSPSGPITPQDTAYLSIVSPTMSEFRSALTSGNIEGAIRALGPTGIIRKEDSPRDDLAKLALELAKSNGARRLPFLPRAAKLALWIGNIDTAEKYAMETLRLDPPNSSFHDGEAIHDGNMVLGLITLRRGDVDSARAYLRQSLHANESLVMRTTGVNLSLASELLRHGEREVVISYLESVGRFWVSGRRVIDMWITKIRSGEDPEFDVAHFCL